MSLLHPPIFSRLSRPGWFQHSSWKWIGLAILFLFASAQFVGAYLLRVQPYLDLSRFEQGYERLPFQTRLLFVPLLRWADHNASMVRYASRLAENRSFYPYGVTPAEIVEFYLGILSVLIAGWVATQFYKASTRRHLLGSLVYPAFLGLCVISYILHTAQSFRFFYDLPGMAFFSVGLYLIYFRKPVLWLVVLFAIATLNRETTLLLLPFYVISQGIHEDRFEWRRIFSPRTLSIVLLLLAYWILWHLMIFHLFRHNPSEYYPRIQFNFLCFRRIRYYPQLFSSLGYLLPFLILYRRHVHDLQLRLWMWGLPIWYACMFVWGILIETRLFGELLAFVATISVLMVEELIVQRVQRDQMEEIAAVSQEEFLQAETVE
jgi:hypothetical protein